MNAWHGRDEVSPVERQTSTREELGSKSLIMDWQSARNKWWIRLVALIVVICFIHQDIVWAQGGTPVWSKQPNGSFSFKGDKSNVMLNGNNLNIPRDVAVTKEVYGSSGSDKTIINIQDAHASFQAQESIASILDSLVTNYDLKVVAMEGSSGYIDTSVLGTFPDEAIRARRQSTS